MDIVLKAIEAKLHSAGLNWIKLQTFQLRPKDKTVAAEVLLEGETAPVSVQITYEVGQDYVKILTLQTSKVWMTEAGNLALLKTGGRINLPGGIQGKLIKFIL